MENKNKLAFTCLKCEFECIRKCDWNEHISTRKHLNRIALDKKIPAETVPKFSCINCRYSCSHTSAWTKHLTTRKHKNRSEPIYEEETNFACKKCNTVCNARSSLWYHEQRCIKPNNPLINAFAETTALMDIIKQNQEIVKQNQEFKTLLLDQQSNLTPTVINNITNHNNTNNSQTNNSNHFNLQVFLNEHCKDAMNLNDFIASIKVDMDDIEYLGEVGYVDGMSTVIVRHINDTEVHKRPMHCTDLKREVIYVKNDNKWTKEGASHENMQKIVNNTYHKNKRAIANWVRDTDPNIARDVTHPLYTKYIRLLSKSLGGYDPQEHNMFSEKIIRSIARGIIIDKEMRQ